nr:hypothetical protein [Tanacetum cinerariifolium]
MCQLDEKWFVITKDTLREALQITSVNNNQAFITPSSSDALINFVNELGYPKRHKFHPRPNSPLYLPNEDHVLGYLKFSAKETNRKVFGMPIPGTLITADIQEASYYQEYLAKMWPSIDGTSKAKPQRKKRKLTTETSDRPSKAGKSKYGFVSKKRTLKSVVESVAEDAPAKESHVYAEDADMHKALEESLKSIYDVPWGLLPLVVIREPESGKYQRLPEVPGKGKAKSDSEDESEKVVPRTDAGVKVKARLDQTLVLKLKARRDQTLVLKMKAKLDQTLMNNLKARLDQTLRIDELEHIMANLIQENNRLEERLDKHGAHVYTLEQLDIPHQVSKAVNEVVMDAVDWAMQAPI